MLVITGAMVYLESWSSCGGTDALAWDDHINLRRQAAGQTSLPQLSVASQRRGPTSSVGGEEEEEEEEEDELEDKTTTRTGRLHKRTQNNKNNNSDDYADDSSCQYYYHCCCCRFGSGCSVETAMVRSSLAAALNDHFTAEQQNDRSSRADNNNNNNDDDNNADDPKAYCGRKHGRPTTEGRQLLPPGIDCKHQCTRRRLDDKMTADNQPYRVYDQRMDNSLAHAAQRSNSNSSSSYDRRLSWIIFLMMLAHMIFPTVNATRSTSIMTLRDDGSIEFQQNNNNNNNNNNDDDDGETMIRANVIGMQSEDDDNPIDAAVGKSQAPKGSYGLTYSSLNAQRRRSNCSYDGFDLLENNNRHRIEFNQNVYVLENIPVNSPVGSMLFKFSASFNGYTGVDFHLVAGYEQPSGVGPLASGSFSISSSDDTFAIQPLLQSDDRTAWYSVNVNRQLQYFINRQHRYLFELRAWSPNIPSLYSRAIVQVGLSNFNMHAPHFISSDNFDVSETVQTGHVIGVVQAVDYDGDRIRYKQQGEMKKFRIDEKSGVIELLTDIVTKNDKDTKFYKIPVDVTDDASSCPVIGVDRCYKKKNRTVITVSITDVNTQAPHFTSEICGKSIEISEHTDSSFSIGQLTAIDGDRGDNGQIEFFFPESTGKNDAYEKFRLEPHAQFGAVRNVSLYATESFDYDAPHAINTYFLLVFARDSGRQRRQDFCFLKIMITDQNDNSPIFVLSRWHYRLREKSHMIQNGGRLFRVIASDKDSGENGRVQYSMKENMYFDVERDSGFVVIKNSSIGKNFSETFEISAADCGMPPKHSEISAIVEISVSESGDSELEWENEQFNDFSVNISEKFHSKNGPANIFDREFDGNIMFYSYGNTSNPRFHLSPRPEDQLFVGSRTKSLGPVSELYAYKYAAGIRLTSEPDAEVKDRHYLYLRVEDIHAKQSLVGLCRVFIDDENDQIPFFDSSDLRFSMLEGTVSNMSIGHVQAFDQDKTYPNNYVRYRFRQGESPDVRRMFSVRENGEIIAHGEFDREKQSVWNFYVESYDGANGYGLSEPNTDSVAIRVELIDINDNSPRFDVKSIQITVSELTEPGQTVVDLNCEDIDFDTELQFSIVSGNELGHFAIRRQRKPRRNSGIEVAELYVVGRLDWDLKSHYALKVMASDSLNVDEVMVLLNLTSTNIKHPVFGQIPNVRVLENSTANSLVVVSLNSNSLPIGTGQMKRSIHYSIVDGESMPWFKLEGDRLSVVEGLNRDPPDGKPSWIIPVVAVDEWNSTSSLKTYALINLTVDDVNDNPPKITGGPFIMMENIKDPKFYFLLDDDDERQKGHGKPYRLPSVVSSTLHSYKDFTVQHVFEPHQAGVMVSGESASLYKVVYKGRLDREAGSREFTLTFKLRDSGGKGGRANVPVIIGDANDNEQYDGYKQVMLFRHMGRTRCIPPSVKIGDVFVEDLDDWDRTEKTFSLSPDSRFFSVDDEGQVMISGDRNAAKFLNEDKYELKVVVFDRMFGTSVVGTVDVIVEDVNEKQIHNAAVVRIVGHSPDSFLHKQSPVERSPYDMLIGNLSAILHVPAKTVKLFTVRKANDRSRQRRRLDNVDASAVIDVYVSVRSLSRSHLESKLRQSDYLKAAFNIAAVSPSECEDSPDVCPPHLHCFDSRIVKANRVHLVNTNRSSLAGLDVRQVTDCVCDDHFNVAGKKAKCASFGGWCRNGGRCRDDTKSASGYVCDCPVGFDGPRCEALERTFEKNGYAKYKAVSHCQPNRFHMEFSSLSEAKAGLLMLNGDPQAEFESDQFFIAIQILNGSIVVNFGSNIVIKIGSDVVDGNWHHIDIEQVGEFAKIYLDQCDMAVLTVPYSFRNSATTGNLMIESVHQTVESKDSAIYLGGLPQRLRVKDVFRRALYVHEFEGCIRNVMINGQFLDLFIPSNPDGSNYKDSQIGPCPCRHQIFCDVDVMPRILVPSLPWWIWLVILIILFALIVFLSLTLIGFMRRRNQLFLEKMYSVPNKKKNKAIGLNDGIYDDQHDSILYGNDDDDGTFKDHIMMYGDAAGEQDQTSFDLSLLKKPTFNNANNEATLDRVNGDLHGCLCPPDTPIIFAYEGEGNSMHSSQLSILTHPHEDELQQASQQDDPTRQPPASSTIHSNKVLAKIAGWFESPLMASSQGSYRRYQNAGESDSHVPFLSASHKATTPIRSAQANCQQQQQTFESDI